MNGGVVCDYATERLERLRASEQCVEVTLHPSLLEAVERAAATGPVAGGTGCGVWVRSGWRVETRRFCRATNALAHSVLFCGPACPEIEEKDQMDGRTRRTVVLWSVDGAVSPWGVIAGHTSVAGPRLGTSCGQSGDESIC